MVRTGEVDKKFVPTSEMTSCLWESQHDFHIEEDIARTNGDILHNTRTWEPNPCNDDWLPEEAFGDDEDILLFHSIPTNQM